MCYFEATGDARVAIHETLVTTGAAMLFTTLVLCGCFFIFTLAYLSNIARFDQDVPFDVEYRLATKLGQYRWFRGRGQVLRAEDGSPTRMAGSIQDITSLKQAHQTLAHHQSHLEELVKERSEELDRSRDELRRSERLASIGTLAAGMAHPINNPLGAILNGAQMALLSEGDSDAKAVWKPTLEDSIEQARRCGGIVRSILQFSRDEPTEKRIGDVGEVVEQAYALTRTYARERGATVELEACPSGAMVSMSAIEIEQVLTNLIRNGIESRPTGAHIVLRAGCGPKTVRIEVRDNGPGIGLSVAHGMVLDHGGTISVESELGTGTSISVELPLCVET